MHIYIYIHIYIISFVYILYINTIYLILEYVFFHIPMISQHFQKRFDTKGTSGVSLAKSVK
jgi:hypothetical protein